MFKKDFFHQLLRRRLTIISLVILSVILFLGISAPYLAPHDPSQVALQYRFQPPSHQFPLGTDNLGRCNLSRLMFATRVSLSTALIVICLTMIIGIAVGTCSGYRGGWVDNLFMRLCDIVMAFPSLVLTLVIIGMLGPGFLNIIIALVSVQWVWYARIIRGMVLSLKERNFILAARASGTSDLAIIARHIMPGIIPQLAVLATLDLGGVIMHISGLSFLGLGIQPPTPELGAMLNDGKQFIRNDQTLMIYPGLVILLAVVSFNLLGDSLRDVFEELRR